MSSEVPFATEKRIRLRELVKEEGCTPAPGAYDVLSAKLVEQAGFDVAYVGSFASAASAFGLPDVGALTLTEMVNSARIVADMLNIPVIADAEYGFFDAANIWRTVREFENAGVAAIHIEDHQFGKHTEFPVTIFDADAVSGRIKAACDARRDESFMIIGRTDSFLANGDIHECVDRVNRYLEAGADAAMISGPSAKRFATVRDQINGPLMTNGSYFHKDSTAAETEAGLNLSLHWPMLIYAAYKSCQKTLEEFKETGDCSKISLPFDEPDFNELLPFGGFSERVSKYR